MERRDFLARSSGATAVAIAASVGLPAHAQTAAVNAPGWNKAAFDSKSLADAAKAMGATSAPVESKDLMLRAPEIAENGNVVRVGALSNIAGTTQIAFVVEKNPSALARWANRPTCTRWPRRATSITTPSRKSKSPSAAAAVDTVNPL